MTSLPDHAAGRRNRRLALILLKNSGGARQGFRRSRRSITAIRRARFILRLLMILFLLTALAGLVYEFF